MKTATTTTAAADAAAAATTTTTTTTTTITRSHVVRLEDPEFLEKITTKLGLPEDIRELARSAAKQNDASGRSSDADKKAFGVVTWEMAWKEAPELAQQIWVMAQR
jgi:hypothetical protein